MKTQMTCTRCGGQIQYVEPPLLPEGIGSAWWEGYFHVDRRQEHFVAVGWHPETPMGPGGVTQR